MKVERLSLLMLLLRHNLKQFISWSLWATCFSVLASILLLNLAETNILQNINEVLILYYVLRIIQFVLLISACLLMLNQDSVFSTSAFLHTRPIPKLDTFYAKCLAIALLILPSFSCDALLSLFIAKELELQYIVLALEEQYILYSAVCAIGMSAALFTKKTMNGLLLTLLNIVIFLVMIVLYAIFTDYEPGVYASKYLLLIHALPLSIFICFVVRYKRPQLKRIPSLFLCLVLLVFLITNNFQANLQIDKEESHIEIIDDNQKLIKLNPKLIRLGWKKDSDHTFKMFHKVETDFIHDEPLQQGQVVVLSESSFSTLLKNGDEMQHTANYLTDYKGNFLKWDPHQFQSLMVANAKSQKQKYPSGKISLSGPLNLKEIDSGALQFEGWIEYKICEIKTFTEEIGSNQFDHQDTWMYKTKTNEKKDSLGFSRYEVELTSRWWRNKDDLSKYDAYQRVNLNKSKSEYGRTDLLYNHYNVLSFFKYRWKEVSFPKEAEKEVSSAEKRKEENLNDMKILRLGLKTLKTKKVNLTIQVNIKK